ncbi:MAG: hypothetical protein WDO19_03220 [Bacteroidota bacterium]
MDRGVKKENSLTISPNGSKIFVGQNKKALSARPLRLTIGNFYYSKQPKENWYKERLVDAALEIDASNWTYVLLEYEDGKIEILLKANTISHLDTETKRTCSRHYPDELTWRKIKN